MSFLAPLFLAGVALVGLPLWFHLFRRQTPTWKPFSSLLFLQASPPVQTRRSRIQDLFLLLLRCLAIGLICMAFARPYFEEAMPVTAGAKEVKNMVVLVDLSASMRREDLWSQAKAKVGLWLGKLGEADVATLIGFDSQARVLMSGETWARTPPGERGTASGAVLAGVQPGWGSTHLGKALSFGLEQAGVMGATLPPGAKRMIVVISDLQQGARLEGLQGLEWPKGFEVIMDDVRAKQAANAFFEVVAPLVAKGQGVGVPKLRVRNGGGAQADKLRLGWAGAAEVAQVDVYVPAGQARVVDGPGWPAGAVGAPLVLKGDGVEFDNQVWMVRPVDRPVKVLYVGGESTNDLNQPLFYLRRALGAAVAPRIDLEINTPVELAKGVSSAVALVVGGGTVSPEAVAALRAYVEGGGKVWWMLRGERDAEAVAGLLGVPAVAVGEKSGAGATWVRVDASHAVLRAFSDSRYSDFSSLQFWKHRRLDLTGVTGVRALARFDDGDVALVERAQGKGGVLLMTSSWAPQDSQLARSTKFVPLVFGVVEWAVGSEPGPAAFVVGDMVRVWPTGLGAEIKRPDGRMEKVAAGVGFAGTDQPGLYHAAWEGGGGDFVVNVEAREGRTEPIPLEELQRMGLPLASAEAGSAPAAVADPAALFRAATESEQKLWRWFVVAALVILGVETLLAGVLTRRRVEAAA